MNDYIGKVCPYCKTKFVPGDDIVVCSDCDMPHHKDCWIENQGCTTFGCLGTIKTAEKETTSVTSSHMNYDDSGAGAAGGVVFCSQCGTRNSAGFGFCGRCGSRLIKRQQAPQVPAYGQGTVYTAPHTAQQPAPYQPQVNYQQPNYQPQVNYQQPNYQPQANYQQPNYQPQANYQQPNYQPQANYQQPNYQPQVNYQQPGYQQPYATVPLDPHLQRLVGPKWAYYLPRFQKLKAQGKSTSWNWAACLVPSYWMIYRKMYVYGAIATVIEILYSAINSALLSLLMLGGYIAMGILGNFIYLKHLEDKAEEARTMPEPYKTQFLLTNGGVNTTAVVLTVIGRLVFAVFLVALQM